MEVLGAVIGLVGMVWAFLVAIELGMTLDTGMIPRNARTTWFILLYFLGCGVIWLLSMGLFLYSVGLIR